MVTNSLNKEVYYWTAVVLCRVQFRAWGGSSTDPLLRVTGGQLWQEPGEVRAAMGRATRRKTVELPGSLSTRKGGVVAR